MDNETILDTCLVRGEYSRILKNYLEYCPRERLIVLLTDDLEQNPQFLIDSVMVFLGLDQGFSSKNLGEKYYVGGSRNRFPWLIPVTQKIPPLRWAWRTLPHSQKARILWWFHTLFNVVRDSPSPQMPVELRRRLGDFYHSDVMELEGLLGRKVCWQEFRETCSSALTSFLQVRA